MSVTSSGSARRCWTGGSCVHDTTMSSEELTRAMAMLPSGDDPVAIMAVEELGRLSLESDQAWLQAMEQTSDDIRRSVAAVVSPWLAGVVANGHITVQAYARVGLVSTYGGTRRSGVHAAWRCATGLAPAYVGLPYPTWADGVRVQAFTWQFRQMLLGCVGVRRERVLQWGNQADALMVMEIASTMAQRKRFNEVVAWCADLSGASVDAVRPMVQGWY